MQPILAATAFAFVLTPLLAQRPTPTFEWQKRTTTIEFGAVLLGKHTISELPVGQTWRMGMGEASTWSLTMPVIAGDRIFAPGTYRVQLQRNDEAKCAIVADGSGKALGDGADGTIPGPLGKAQKPTKKLAIEWQKNGAVDRGNQPARIVLQFGESEWHGDVTIVGGKTVNLPGWKLTVFSLPAALLEGRAKSPVPCAVLTKGKDEAWNVVLGAQDVKLVPWMTKPTEEFGFGAIVPPDPKLTGTGKVESIENKADKPYEVAEHLASSLTKGQFSIDIGFGKEAVRLTLFEPGSRAGK